MNTFTRISLLSLAGAVAAMAEAPAPPEGFTALFNGEDLTGWYGNNPHQLVKPQGTEKFPAVIAMQEEFNTHWTVENGELVNDGKGPYATTNKEYGDVEFHVDYKTVALADSGIYMRGAPQIQIWDFTEEGGKWDKGANFGSGGLWNNTAGTAGKDPLELADKPFGEWNRFKVRMLGARTWVWLNDQKVVDGAIWENYWDKSRTTPLAAQGPIHLQTHGGEIRWKGIYLKEIKPAEANNLLRERTDAEFTSLFNGMDLSGWQGATENYEVVNGALQCKDGKGGVLFTDDQYGDFVARLEFKLPKGGNNGLAIRYPGEGSAAYDGMCELQILDNTDTEKYGKLDRRQFHGSAYGIVGAHKGYLRPVGQWNYQEVTVKGSTIKVELNGTVILDADLSKFKRFMAGTPHPGLGLKSGHFGFAGHNDPVMFRKIEIREL